jgi:hypothetical protein
MSRLKQLNNKGGTYAKAFRGVFTNADVKDGELIY